MIRKITLILSLLVCLLAGNASAQNATKKIEPMKSVEVKDSSILAIIDDFIYFCDSVCHYEKEFPKGKYIFMRFTGMLLAVNDSLEEIDLYGLNLAMEYEVLAWEKPSLLAFSYGGYTVLINELGEKARPKIVEWMQTMIDTKVNKPPIDVEITYIGDDYILAEGGGGPEWHIYYKDNEIVGAHTACFGE